MFPRLLYLFDLSTVIKVSENVSSVTKDGVLGTVKKSEIMYSRFGSFSQQGAEQLGQHFHLHPGVQDLIQNRIILY